jgi:ProQ/FINO family
LSYYVAQCLEALSELKAKGFPVPRALTVDEPQPLALTTREDIAAYVARQGGGEDEARLLGQTVAALTRTPRYVEALAADLSARVSILTGEAVGLVSETDRHSAALQIHARAMRSNKPAGVRDVAPAMPKPAAAPKPPQPPAPKAAAPLPPTPFRNGGQLSAGEIEKRRQALAALKPKTSAPA